MAYASRDLPVPEVLAIGDAFDGSFAISRRHHGRFLEDIEPDEAGIAGPMVRRLLLALRQAPFAGGERDGPWRDWLRASLRDADPLHPTHGWRSKLAAHPKADAVFREADERLVELIAALPERRDLVHGDLLHRNVLVSDDASRVEAVFSWKCSMRGDFLYDVAWCTFWGAAFHRGIDALDVFTSLEDDHDSDAVLRHHSYELHIGASHLGWYAWTDETEALERLTQLVAGLLAR
jgi:Ser/Thr protein kinase RdoA (MazF antagonist)